MTDPAHAAAPAVEAARLRQVLDGLLAGQDPPRRVAELSRRPAAYYSSFRMEDLDVRLDDGAALSLVFKDLGVGGLLHDARRCKPEFLIDPRREIAVYRHLLRPAALGPAFLGAVEDAAAGTYWLFVERVDGVPLWQVGDLSAWRAAARWAAALHARFAGDGPSLAGRANVIRYDRHYYSRWAGRAAGRAARRLGRLFDQYDAVVRRLTRLPVTLIHGEFHASNILVREDTGEHERVYPVDWEMAALGPGLMDLADLTAGKWTEAERQEIVRAYREAAPPSETFDEDLDYCRLHRAVQWVGWADEWVPPREHAQDWAAEAARLGRRLGFEV